MRVGNQEVISAGSVTTRQTVSTGFARCRSNRITGRSPALSNVASLIDRFSFHLRGRLLREALFQLVEAAAPELPVRFQPGIELDQRFCAQPIEPPLAIGSHGHQTSLTQNAQVLGNRWLAHAQPLDEGLDGLLALAQRIEDVAPRGVGNDLDDPAGCHTTQYASRVICLSRHISARLRLDWHARQRAPLNPRAVIYPHSRIAEQVAEHQPGLTCATSDSTVRDDLLVGGEAARLAQRPE